MKTRVIGSVEEAMWSVRKVLSPEVCAEALGISTSAIYKMSDSDHASKLSLERAMTLDKLCAAVNGQTPFLSYYQHELSLQNLPQAVDVDAIKEASLRLTSQSASLGLSIIDAVSEHSDGGKHLTAAERAKLQAQREELTNQVAHLDTLLRPAITTTATH